MESLKPCTLCGGPKEQKRSWCKQCMAKASKVWRAANPEKVREQKRRAYARDPQKRVRSVAEWRTRNPEKYRAQLIRRLTKLDREQERLRLLEWKRAHKEKCAQWGREYRQTNPDKIRAATRRSQAAKLRAVVPWSDHKAVEEMYTKAAQLTADTGIPHEVDHIVPLQSAIVCGLHVPANLRVVPAFDNRSKGNRHWPDMP